MQRLSAALTVLLLAGASVAPVGTAATSTQQGEAYAGTYVEFETTGDAVVDYTVDGDTVLQSVEVQSKSEAESRGDVGVGVDLGAVTEVTASALSVESRSEVSATVTADSGATMTAHDNSNGILVVRSDGESQYVTVGVDSSAEAERESDSRVVVTTDDGTEGVFMVVGEGAVTVNEDGNVSANVGSEGSLVFRSYPDERDDDDRETERLITEGEATAEVHVMEASEGSGEFAADVVQYADTSVEVTQRTEGTVSMTADRSRAQGTVVVTSVSERAIGSAEDLDVTVDGEAAAEASSYSQLESAADDGDTSRFLVQQQSSAEASTDVLVAVNRFSEREITLSEGDGQGGDGGDGGDSGEGGDGDGDNGSDGNTTTGGGGPGFGLVAVTIALALAAVTALARRRRS